MNTICIWVCPCGYHSTSPGKCRSHPTPCRAMGPEMSAVLMMPVSEHNETVKRLLDTTQRAVAECKHLIEALERYARSQRYERSEAFLHRPRESFPEKQAR